MTGPVTVQHSRTVDPAEWEALLAASDDAGLCHTLDWLTMTAEVFSLEVHVLVARVEGRIVGAFPLHLDRRLRQARSGPMGPAGPLTVRDLSPAHRAVVTAALSRAVARWAWRHGVRRVTCAAPALAPARRSDPVSPLPPRWRVQSTQTLLLHLDNEPSLRERLHPDVRRMMRMAETAGLRVERARWLDLLDDYYRLHEATYRRTGAEPHPRRYFEGIATLAERGRAVLWVARDATGRPVAFHNSARYGDGAFYSTGCSDPEAARVGANYLVFWGALLGALADGCRWYEIGEVFPETTAGKAHGLTVFKRKFGGEPHPYHRAGLLLVTPGWLLGAPWRLITRLVTPSESSEDA